MKFFRNIKKYFRYAVRSAKAELISEVSGSFLSWIWWILDPLCYSLIYVIVFGFIFKSTQEYFPIFVVVGLAAWTFFNRMVTGSVKLIKSNRDLVTKIYIPKYILVLSKSFTYLFKFMISIAIAIVLMIIYGVPFTWNMLYFFIIVPVLYIISFGISLIVMHLGVFIEDMQNVIAIALRLVFYLSGVFYSIPALVDGAVAQMLLHYNAAAFLMNELRNALIYAAAPDFLWLAVWLAAGCLITALGVHIIHKYENSYAKVI